MKKYISDKVLICLTGWLIIGANSDITGITTATCKDLSINMVKTTSNSQSLKNVKKTYRTIEKGIIFAYMIQQTAPKDTTERMAVRYIKE